MERVIFLVDMNAFYIACETTRNPQLAGRPAAVAGDPQKRAGIILAANYEARAFGVKTTMTLYEACGLCPDLKLVPPDHAFYEEKSKEVMLYLSGYTPLLEQNSIDEAYLDLTGCEALNGPPLQAARSIQKGINRQFGLWCSIGIAPNKFLAKMASELKKPMGITCLEHPDVPARLWPLPIRSLYGVGAATAARLQDIGIQTIGDLSAVDASFLTRLFGKYGLELHQHAHGLDDRPVTPTAGDSVKSIGRSTTLAHDLTDLEAARAIILALTDEVGASARHQGKKAHTVQLTLKFNDFRVITRQSRIRPTCTTKDLYAAACRLLVENWQRQRPVRLLGVSITGFDQPCDLRQLSVFDLAGGTRKEEREEKLDRTIDAIRDRYGSGYVTYGKLVSKAKDRPERD